MRAPEKQARWLSPEGLQLIESWARRGLSEQALAQAMGIRPSALRRWRCQSEELDRLLFQSAARCEAAVEEALFRRATGYTCETRQTVDSEKDHKATVTLKQVPGDLNAQIFWLQHRSPDRWSGRGGPDIAGQTASGCVLLPEVEEDDDGEEET